MVPISFEFFPPKTPAQRENLGAARALLEPLSPEFYSVTFGAGGSTRDHTVETILEINKQGQNAAPHLSCMGATSRRLRDLLDIYTQAGVTRMVALRGDRPSGMAAPGEFKHASDLIEFVRDYTGDQFHIEVACYPEFHPESASPGSELEHFKRKLDAGANSAITQYFYNADAYGYFVEDCQKIGIDAPIVPGIMPVTNFTQLARFSDVCGAELPRWLRRRLEQHQNDKAAISEIGTEFVGRLCRQLIDLGAPALHFYTLNRAEPSLAILDQI